MKNDDFGDRMKTYENVTRNYLTRRTPVIIRIDGKSFHSFTRGFEKPFDNVLVKSMQHTMKYLCENIEGCVIGYTQSDEITLVLCDYKKLTSQAWFNNNIQKICSVSASMATRAFNEYFFRCVQEFDYDNQQEIYGLMNVEPSETLNVAQFYKLRRIYVNRFFQAVFDGRVFNIPKEEVNNCLLWRQQDAIRNSIQSAAQANFNHKQLEGMNCKQLQEKLLQEKNINWNDYPTHLKQGSCCVKETYIAKINGKDEEVTRSRWIIDTEIPIFSKDTDYVNKRITFDEEE